MFLFTSKNSFEFSVVDVIGKFIIVFTLKVLVLMFVIVFLYEFLLLLMLMLFFIGFGLKLLVKFVGFIMFFIELLYE